MKIRIKGNSLRLRLTKTDVAIFNKEGEYQEKIEFGQKKLCYALKAKLGIQDLEADFIEDTITVYFPEEEKQTWALGNRVGYSNMVSLANNTELFILVEKDFTCLDNTIEDQSDNYPNPKLNP